MLYHRCAPTLFGILRPMFGLIGFAARRGYPAALFWLVAADAGIEYDSNPARVPSDAMALSVSITRRTTVSRPRRWNPVPGTEAATPTVSHCDGKSVLYARTQSQNVLVAQLGYEHGPASSPICRRNRWMTTTHFQASAPTYLGVTDPVRRWTISAVKPRTWPSPRRRSPSSRGCCLTTSPIRCRAFAGPSLLAKLGGRIHAQRS